VFVILAHNNEDYTRERRFYATYGVYGKNDYGFKITADGVEKHGLAHGRGQITVNKLSKWKIKGPLITRITQILCQDPLLNL
jgi:hypothetical protein